MKVCLLDVDGKIPNLALMRASTVHKANGDSVKLGYDPLFDNPDICYASKIFDFTDEPEYMPQCKTLKGGTGYDMMARMPFDDYERIMPDYSLYPYYSYAIGRFTRGCSNNCPWCVVPKMDGNDVRKVSDLKDFWDGQEVVNILDDNIMQLEEVFIDACKQMSEAHVRASWNALDIRLVNKQTASALASVKHEGSIHFSWDGKHQDEYIERGLKLLNDAGMKPWRFMFYVLIGFNTSREYDLYRVEKLRELGAYPFAMPYDKNDRYQKDFARWVNNKALWKSIKWHEYDCPTNRGDES